MKGFFKLLRNLLTYQEGSSDTEFVLKEAAEEKKDQKQKQTQKISAENQKVTRSRGRRKQFENKLKETQEEFLAEDKNLKELLVEADLEYNKKQIEFLYDIPKNKDIILREFNVGTIPHIQAFAVMIDGLSDTALVGELLQSLMVFSRVLRPGGKITESILENLLPGQQTKLTDNYQEVLEAINYGDTAFFFQGSDRALLVETKGFEHRQVDKPANEQVIVGPHEAFNEVLKVNTGLLRRIMRTKDLTTEYIKVGERVPNDVAVIYLRNLANPALVDEVKRRISSLKTDYLLDSGMLEDLIEDKPYNLSPQTISTERPDKVASYLIEGKVAIIVNGSPHALVVPATIYAQLHTGEESYLRWQYGTFIRYVRLMAFLMSFLLPGCYLAVMLYHQEMIPTELLLAIAGNREKVPFPSIVELILMELSFELLREAGIRIPGLIGPTIGIVGALILGQASVEANLVSPILVVLVAVTGLASFAIPNYALSFALRIYRFIYIFLGWSLGFFGITIGLFIHIMISVNLKSFGVPYFSPVAPSTKRGRDVLTRWPLFLNKRRPDYLSPQDVRRSPAITRGWVKQKVGKEEGGK